MPGRLLSLMMPGRSLLPRGPCLLATAAFLLGGVLEPAWGLLRDGQVHHETTASAGVHAQVTGSGDHGHEDGSDREPGHSHAPGHQHGTSADHCTHMHGVGIVSTHDIGFTVSIVSVDEVPGLAAAPLPQQVHSPPPRV